VPWQSHHEPCNGPHQTKPATQAHLASLAGAFRPSIPAAEPGTTTDQSQTSGPAESRL
jgi:hypothetical protein